jgi:hypothetical protein
MTDIEKLIERLVADGDIYPEYPILKEAAAALRSLVAENERLDCEITKFWKQNADFRARAEKAEAALTKIVAYYSDCPGDPSAGMEIIASEALNTPRVQAE